MNNITIDENEVNKFKSKVGKENGAIAHVKEK
jgi:hypothetical protein